MSHDFNYILVQDRRVIFDAWVNRDDPNPTAMAKLMFEPFRDLYPGSKIYVRLSTEYDDNE